MAEPLLSIIIPAYNEEHRLPGTLQAIHDFLARQPYSAEVLVVENGSTDATLAVAQGFAERLPYLRVFHEDVRGKGWAVRRGMLAAVGAYRFICDADLSMPITEVNRFLPPQLPAEVDIAIASREAPGARRYGEPEIRHLAGRAFNLLVRLLALPGLQDTQCGFKMFRAAVAEDLFRYQTIYGWTFDVEILFIARRRGYKVVEIPIPWYFNPESKVRMWRDARQMFLDVLKIRHNARRGLYDTPPRTL
ncbi:dolichyl-phosphate beta-glucosyltransferase [uncultured Thermanaerothrix sp.]|uniref:dolichyl-phosphate beta-glucosyltransferase n=1 Tax=uncultured Thermanaerothrix sp. TaxID=1195149 RepID=UPI00262D69CB|nr:dolichyl-phosphate beta-glucosyltransferase [uncultured Thermanaerothrix sp.]